MMFHHLSCAVLLFTIVLAHVAFGSPEAVEFDNSTLPETMRTEDYFKDLADSETHGNVAKSRSKRFVTFNVLAPVDLGLLLAIPITLILPSMANLWSKRFKRSIPQEKPENYEDDPIVQTHLDRLANYFELLQIPERSCQQRAVCEFAAAPEKYYPVSDMVLQRIRNPDLPSIAMDEDVKPTKKGQKSLYKIYNKAADKGMMDGEDACHQEFIKYCPYSIEKRLNMPVLRFWKALGSLLKFTVKDTA